MASKRKRNENHTEDKKEGKNKRNSFIPDIRLLLSMGDSRILGGLGEVTWLIRDGR